jgi:hypothetical protein
LEGPPPQAVLTREQNKSLQNQVFSLFGGVPYPPEFFPQKRVFYFYFILFITGEKKYLNNFLLVDYHIV